MNVDPTATKGARAARQTYASVCLYNQQHDPSYEKDNATNENP